jgi:hypothetical protein
MEQASIIAGLDGSYAYPVDATSEAEIAAAPASPPFNFEDIDVAIYRGDD